jgi:tetratricopeptide (TPR) repeat protein
MVALWEEALPFLVAAVRAYGAAVLARAPDAEADTAAGVGRRLLWGILGGQAAGARLPEALAALVPSPDDAGALDALGGEVAAALHDDPHLQASVVETLTGFYRREIEAGSTEAMVQLGDFLRTQGDPEGARAWFQRAIDSGDVEAATEALVDLGRLLLRRDPEGARAAFQQAIDSGHPEWAPAAMVGLGHLLRNQGDSAGARAAYQQAAGSGHADWAANALVMVCKLLGKDGDAAGARDSYLRVIDSGHADWAPPALIELLNLLREQDDLDGARAVYRRAIETGNPDASYGLLVIGQLLGQRGDAEGARAVFQEAADAGDELAQHELKAMSRED